MGSPSGRTESVNRAVAPTWHTVIILLILFILSFAGARSGSLPFVRAYGRSPGYVLLMTIEWATVAFIAFGIRSRGFSLRSLIGGSWACPAAVLRDLGIALAFLILCGIGVLNGLGYLLKAESNQAINMFPQGRTEVVLCLIMALTAGFCEEVIFRGYLQRQFTAMGRASVVLVHWLPLVAMILPRWFPEGEAQRFPGFAELEQCVVPSKRRLRNQNFYPRLCRRIVERGQGNNSTNSHLGKAAKPRYISRPDDPSSSATHQGYPASSNLGDQLQGASLF